MSLLNRYIHEVGRFLPRKSREDIQAELRSSVVDALEDRFGTEPTEAEIEEMLIEFGSPREVAASYNPGSQYLIGPGLYPLFRMISWIVVAAVLGAQLLAFAVAVFVAGEPFSALETIASLLTSVPTALGWVLLTFMVLQYFDAKPYLEEESWDPKALPELDPEEKLKKGELIFGLVAGILVLVLVTLFPQWVGFLTMPGGKFYANPVILDYLVLIQISLLANILLDIYVLWKGSWSLVTRIGKLVLEAFGVVILAFLVQGHNTWLAARGSSSFSSWFSAIESSNWELVGMHAFRLGFAVAFIVSVIEILTGTYRLVRSKMASDLSAKDFMLKVE